MILHTATYLHTHLCVARFQLLKARFDGGEVWGFEANGAGEKPFSEWLGGEFLPEVLDFIQVICQLI